ncbi:MAG: hypothetical protein BGO25_10845 [Acidobacteriales bacterium 59-55]|nr:MAG: hypothetical protein ABT04_01135 [Granulicella sp. SCN 62-9]OJV43673.1 MAG: hypothetical protein BGO25_10845 [Acidobacteriales bacterium 59-55]
MLLLSTSLIHAQAPAPAAAPQPASVPETAPTPAPTPVPTPAPVPAAPAATAPAATVRPNLTGTWSLDLARSNYDQVPPPTSEFLVFAQAGSGFTVGVTSDNDRGKEVYTLPFATDGTETPTPKGTFSDTATLQYLSTKGEWKGAALVLTQKITYEGAPGSLQSTFTLSPDGRTLTRAMHISVDQGEFDTTSVYDKQ